jgi:hypothetical protein
MKKRGSKICSQKIKAMHCRLLIVCLLLLGAQIPLLAQKLPPIQLDRPDQTECPFIVPKGYVQVETGFNIEDIGGGVKSYTYPTALWKYGINENVEFRLITEFTTVENNGLNISGLAPITVGFKARLVEESGIVPKTSFTGHLTTATVGSKAFHTDYTAPSFRFLMQHTLSSKLSLSYNLGAEWDGENPGQTFLYTLTTGYAISERLGAYFELFGFAPADDKARHSFDGGFTFLVNDDFMLDLSGGFRVTDNAPKGYVSLGISYRLKVIK